MNPSPPKKSGPEFLLPGDFQRHGFLRAEERFLPADQRLPGDQLHGDDRAGKRGAKATWPFPVAVKSVMNSEPPPNVRFGPANQAAARVRVHLDLVVHPAHRIGLAVDGLAGRKVDRHGLHDRSVDLVAHRAPHDRRPQIGRRPHLSGSIDPASIGRL